MWFKKLIAFNVIQKMFFREKKHLGKKLQKAINEASKKKIRNKIIKEAFI